MSVAPLIQAMQSVSLEETIARAALLDRIDTKFLLRESDLLQVLEVWQRDYRVLEIVDSREFRYENTYLDSPELDLLRAHLQGRRRRAKCRVRTYVETGQQMVEVKVKGTRGQTIKYRKPLTGTPTSEVCSSYLTQSLEDAYDRVDVQFVRPSLKADYQRITLIAPDFTERITLDHALTFTAVNGDGYFALPADLWIVEKKSSSVKQSTTCPLRIHGHRPVNVSKYVLGMSLVNPGVRSNAYRPIHRVIANIAGEELSSLLPAHA